MKLDLTNKVFGRLTAKFPDGLTSNGSVIWKCNCSCGGESRVSVSNLTSNKTKSCGCLHKEFLKSGKARRTHGMYGTPQHTRDWNNQNNMKRKLEVLSYYSKNGVLSCCGHGCTVSDIDMLTLDHIDNDGSSHRKDINSRGGQSTYLWLIRNGFPKGYQTLCWNHQAKKEIERRRSLRRAD